MYGISYTNIQVTQYLAPCLPQNNPLRQKSHQGDFLITFGNFDVFRYVIWIQFFIWNRSSTMSILCYFLSGLFPVLVRRVFFIILISGIALDFLKMIPINIFVAICKNMRIVLMGCHYRECWIWNWSNTTCTFCQHCGYWWPGPDFCLLLGVSSDYAQPITGQVTEVTCPVIGGAQPEVTLSKRQKMGPDAPVSSSSLNGENAPMHCQLCYFRSHV